jgi:predicted YcjX-like family ATPase
LRVIVEYQSRSGANKTLTLDIVDYPGEWLLDLPLLVTSFGRWSAASLASSRQTPRDALSRDWHTHLAALDPTGPARESDAIEAARRFGDYLRACRDERVAMSLLPPGRFLMPGDLAGSPALTFAPLNVPADGTPPTGSLWAMMQRRYEAYKDLVVRPFFNEHFLRLDRQIVLVDALAAINAGTHAVRDLQMALENVLDCFQVGRRTLLSAMLQPRADRILFAATKADHMHQASHEKIEAVLRRMVQRAAQRAEFSGAAIDVVALAAVRATREASVTRDGDVLPAIVGAPLPADSTSTDSADEVAAFPGDFPVDLAELFGEAESVARAHDMKFIRFRPPQLETVAQGAPALPHIRLDRALQFLIGDRLK